MLVLRRLLVLTALCFTAAVEPPDCLYIAYDCVYYIWDFRDGTGEALVTCDGGSTFSSYGGLFGGCPDYPKTKEETT